MAWANVQVVDTGAKTDAGTNTRTVTLAGATAGNLLVVIAHCYGDLTGGLSELTISGSGWTLVAYRTATPIADQNAFMWAKVAAGGETTVTVTITNALRMCLWAAEYSGNDGLNLDGIGSEYSGSNSTAFYVVSKPVPQYQGGLWVGGLFSMNTSGSGGPGTISGTVLNGATQRGSQTTHYPSGSLAITGWVYDKVSGSSDAPCDISGLPTARFGKIGICAVFRASGATAARTKVSGTNAATLARNNAGSVGGAGATTMNVGGFPAAPDGDLLLVGFTIETGRTVTGVPTGWVLYGSVVLAMGTRALTAYVYYKIASAETGSSYSWTFDAATTYGWILNVWHGGTFTPDVAPTYYPATNSEIFNSGPGTTWSGQIQAGANAIAFTLSRYNGTSSLIQPDVYTGSGGTNPGGGSDFGDKLQLWYLKAASAGLAQDYYTIFEPGAGHLVQNVEFVNFSFLVGGGGDHWAWAEDTSDSWNRVGAGV